jgi:hypothetical protein
MCHLLGSAARLPFGHDHFAQADAQTLFSANSAARHDDFKCASLPHEARQAHGAAVRQGYAPTAVIDAHIGAVGHDATVRPQRKLHAPGDGRALDSRDNRLAQPKPRRPHRRTWNGTAVLGKFQQGGCGGIAACKPLQIGTRAERAAFAPKDGDVCRVVGIESYKSLIQGFSMFWIDGVARLRARMNDR